MNLDLEDTIAALSSPPGPGSRGVLRVSGPDVLKLLRHTFRASLKPPTETLQEIRRASRVSGFIHLDDNVDVPCSVYYWPTHRSYTGQPSAEFQLPGSPPLLESILTALYQNGARPARPGEFTLRSFLAGRVDLVQAEAVLGVIDAEDQVELKTALKQLAGGLSGRLKTLREEMIELVADMEAGLDFIEEDIEFISQEEIENRLVDGLALVDTILNQTASRMTSRTQPKVILAGLPNAGKSTLFNALTEQAEALVSSQEGTTRDYLSHLINWNGISFELFDTAGWETTSPKNQAVSAQENLMSQAHQLRDELLTESDLVLWCTDSTLEQTASLNVLHSYHADFRKLLLIQTKADLLANGSFSSSHESILVSSQSPTDVDQLKSEIVKLLSERGSHDHQFLGSTAARTQDSLLNVQTSLRRALEAANEKWGDDMIAIDLRQAIDHLGEIVGAVYTDDLLGRIFSKFCIGK